MCIARPARLCIIDVFYGEKEKGELFAGEAWRKTSVVGMARDEMRLLAPICILPTQA